MTKWKCNIHLINISYIYISTYYYVYAGMSLNWAHSNAASSCCISSITCDWLRNATKMQYFTAVHRFSLICREVSWKSGRFTQSLSPLGCRLIPVPDSYSYVENSSWVLARNNEVTYFNAEISKWNDVLCIQLVILGC